MNSRHSIETMKLLIVIVVALFGIIVKTQLTPDEQILRDATSTVPELIARANYPVEIHHVITEDGYILEIHRIPASPASPAAQNKPVVFLVHGILSSSADWILTGPGKGLGYILADSGYDVWMGNVRGNRYSRNHTTITDLSSEEYWHFDWHEIAYYDLPAMIDYALQSTAQYQLVYIGFSQGTSVFYVMASLRQEYNDKIKAMFSLAPVAYLAHMKSPLLRGLGDIIDSFGLVTKLLGINEFLPNSKLITRIAGAYCDDESIIQGVCSNIFYSLFGYDPKHLNETQLPVYFGHVPAGGSTRGIIHYGQEFRSKKFAWYNHGLFENLRVYGSQSPPNYDLGAVTAPVHLIYSANDWIAVKEDVERLYSELGNAIKLVKVSDDQWNHIDFTWGINAKEYVYDYILDVMKNM